MAIPLTETEKQQIQQVMSALLAGGAEMGVGALTLMALVKRVTDTKTGIIDVALESEVVGAALERAIIKHGVRYSDQLLNRLERAINQARANKQGAKEQLGARR